MNFTNTVIVFVLGLTALNYVSGGFVFDRVGNSLSGGQGDLLMSAGSCGFAMMFAPPFINVAGYTFPRPSADDLILAGILTMVLSVFISRWLQGWKDWLMCFSFVWLSIRFLAIYLANSNPLCRTLVAESASIMEPIHLIGLILLPVALFKIFKMMK